jgi:hypothetical protein
MAPMRAPKTQFTNTKRMAKLNPPTNCKAIQLKIKNWVHANPSDKLMLQK